MYQDQRPDRDRGRDYNHSSFCDLIINGFVGLHPSAGNIVKVIPLTPEKWDYFALDNLSYHGSTFEFFTIAQGSVTARDAG